MRCQVTIFRDFSEDLRLSMDAYADGLTRAITKLALNSFSVREYVPYAMPWPMILAGQSLQMRLSRYLAYPWQALRSQSDINHIVDHGYAHLLYVLDPRRTVVTVNDLIPLLRWKGTLPDAPRAPHKPWLNMFSFNALRRARHLIAISENTRRDLIAHLGCDPESITVVYDGLDPIFRPYSEQERWAARRTLNLPADTRLILITGSQFYKNNAGAVRAFVEMRRQLSGPLKLLKTGWPTDEWVHSVHEHGLEADAVCLGVLPRERLPDLYNAVDCLLFPSWYEGFGWPPLEAMACGTPVVTSNAGALPEVVGDAGIMVDPNDYIGLACAMHAVLTDDPLRRSLVQRGLARAKQFSWERTARETLNVYERVIRESGLH